MEHSLIIQSKRADLECFFDKIALGVVVVLRKRTGLVEPGGRFNILQLLDVEKLPGHPLLFLVHLFPVRRFHYRVYRSWFSLTSRCARIRVTTVRILLNLCQRDVQH